MNVLGPLAVLLVVVVVVVAAIVGLTYLVSFNRLVARRQEVTDSWATIDVELQRRHVLVPQLVTAVRSAAAHEQTLLTELSRRNDEAAAAAHTAAEATTWEPPLAAAVQQVLALRERYPALNSQQNFLGLQHELAITEDRIAAARRFYNTRVQQLNTAIDAFPSNLVANRHRVTKAEFFDHDGA